MMTRILQNHARKTLQLALQAGWAKVDRNTYRRETGEIVERTATGWRRQGERWTFQSVAAAISFVDHARRVAQSAA